MEDVVKTNDGQVVMVVDDSSEIRDVLVELLVQEGYRVQEAPNGLEALRLLRAGCRPAVILLDLMMPIMDGWRFREEQAKDESIAAIPVVVITAGRHEASLPTATATLRKPFDLEQVLEEIRSYAPGLALSSGRSSV
jgi:CheY-like chemotaxis protein